MKKSILITLFVFVVTPRPTLAQGWPTFDAANLAQWIRNFQLMTNMLANMPGMPLKYRMQFMQMSMLATEGLMTTAQTNSLVNAVNSGSNIPGAYNQVTLPMVMPTTMGMPSTTMARMGTMQSQIQAADMFNMEAMGLIAQTRRNSKFNAQSLMNVVNDGLQIANQLAVLQKMHAATTANTGKLTSIEALNTAQLQQQMAVSMQARNQQVAAIQTDQARQL